VGFYIRGQFNNIVSVSMHDNHLPPFVMFEQEGVQKYASVVVIKCGVQMFFFSVPGVFYVRHEKSFKQDL